MSDKRVSTQILELLQDGQKHSSIDIAKICCCSHPNGTIRDLRNNYNYDIQDEWRTNERGYRYKVFWLDPKFKFKDPNKVIIDLQYYINFNFD